MPTLAIAEDPVTGSLNAGIAEWLFGTGVEQESFTVRQRTALGATGRVTLTNEDGTFWVAGATRIVVTGEVQL